ncbi:DUF262 domain-containing protein [Curtobacterium flaccumfaciens]|uniref:DUF262 domain-containing protein n=1 Tax=Curtobacterium flaccumfaciens TaxID=2035 RepID=UPI003D9A879E
MPRSNIDFNLDGIGHQLKDRRLEVPLYQRSYAWGSDQVRDFCQDLASAFNTDPKEHFMGTIVLSRQDGDRMTVIDGQQRLATTALLLAAIRDHYASHGEDKRAESLDKSFLTIFDDESGHDEPRLTLNTEDDEFFRTFIVRDSVQVRPSRESHELIEAAYRLLADFVAGQAIAAGNQWVSRLVEWRRFIEEDLRVIYVAVPTESDAFMIFETLNDRGAELTLADLLKNYLFSKASTQSNGLEQVRDRWLRSLGALETNQELFITFLRQLWSSRNGITRERDLYKRIKEDVTTPQKAIAFSGDLKEGAKFYAALLSSSHDFWTGWGTGTRQAVETLGRLNLVQNRPMLLAVLKHFPKNEAKLTLRAAASWGVRGLIVGGIGGGTTEKAYCDAAVAIRSGAVKTTTELVTQLSAIIPTDAEFEGAFAITRVTKVGLSRYYLLALENASLGTTQPEYVPNSNEEEVNLEHVLPKNATVGNWPSFPGELHKQWVDRLGNHALLSKGPNDKIGNKSFVVKQPVLASSKMSLTASIGGETAWTAKEIEARQRTLAKLAVKVWPRS